MKTFTIGVIAGDGVGEEVIRNAGSFLVVELMRQGHSPMEACQEAVVLKGGRVVGAAPASELVGEAGRAKYSELIT